MIALSLSAPQAPDKGSPENSTRIRRAAQFDHARRLACQLEGPALGVDPLGSVTDELTDPIG